MSPSPTLDARINRMGLWAEVHAGSILRVSLAIVYLHFGVLKFFPQVSPAETLATQTILALTGNLLDASWALFLLALLETVIGVGFLLGVFRRTIFVLFTFHMLGTLTPLFLLPHATYQLAPVVPTIEGQYIIKNLVYLAAGWTILLPEALRHSAMRGRYTQGQVPAHAIPVTSLPATRAPAVTSVARRAAHEQGTPVV